VQANRFAFRLAEKGEDEQQALNRAFEEVISPPPPENPPEPLDPDLEKKIDAWAEEYNPSD
jgi:hypothetical protein